jgi:cytochrome c
VKPFWIALAAVGALFLAHATAFADGDAARGETVFKRCVACHTIKEGEPNKIGPNLHGLFDRSAGKAPGYSYSASLAGADFKWDDDKLAKWLARPQDFLAGVKMPFNVPSEADRADVISYLRRAAAAQ